ncbi:putative transferase, protein kinase RLK-Pelle-RLCK-VIIa-2 family [Helianthus anomalus]
MVKSAMVGYNTSMMAYGHVLFSLFGDNCLCGNYLVDTFLVYCCFKRPEMDVVVVSRLQKVLALQERSPEREPKFIHKFVSCFRPNAESKGVNLILVGGCECKPSDQLNNPIISTRKDKTVLCDENAPDLSRYQSGSEGDAMIMTRNDKFLPSHTSTTERIMTVFIFEALQTATNYFHNEKFTGKGSFGSVYKGMIHERSLVAAMTRTTVIVLNQHLQSHPGKWLAADNCVGLIDHPNLIKLIGYCTDDDYKLLVYEYME